MQCAQLKRGCRRARRPRGARKREVTQKEPQRKRIVEEGGHPQQVEKGEQRRRRRPVPVGQAKREEIGLRIHGHLAKQRKRGGPRQTSRALPARTERSSLVANVMELRKAVVKGIVTVDLSVVER
jgi:hypothetical protein